MHTVLRFSLEYVYADTDRACALYQATAEEDPALLDYIFCDPPALHDVDPTPTGYVLSLTESKSVNLSYADLGVAFCELATRREEFKGKGVGVFATGPVRTDWGRLAGYNWRGFKARLFG